MIIYNDAVDMFVDHRLALEKELIAFVNGYKGDQPELIMALANKIAHLCISKGLSDSKIPGMGAGVGSPVSVKPMLRSICEGKIKRWSESHTSDLQEFKSGRRRGEAIYKFPPWMHKGEITRRWGKREYKQEIRFNEKRQESYEVWPPGPIIYKGYIEGHFRYYGKVYIANYETRDYIKSFYHLDNTVTQRLSRVLWVAKWIRRKNQEINKEIDGKYKDIQPKP